MSVPTAIRGYDFHCHIDLHPDPPGLIAHCEREHIAVIAVTTTPLAYSQNRTWTKNSEYVHAAVGLHPELVGERYAEANLLERLIGDARLVGEVGLDGSPQHSASYGKQKDVFARVLQAAKTHGGRVLTIHSRRAARDVINLIEQQSDPSKVLCILHWFSGSLAEARRASDAGCYFSVNAAMLRKDRGRSLVRGLPRDRLLTETDSPFITLKGRHTSPVDSVPLLGELAKTILLDEVSTRDLIAANARHVFNFAGLL